MRITEFKEFCHYTVDTIKPSLVLASGDLTDAKTKDSIGSEQYEAEWRHYRDILNETHVRKKTVWLDIRGNHGKRTDISFTNHFSNVFHILQITLMLPIRNQNTISLPITPFKGRRIRGLICTK